jgi:anti-sigma B factor antagonist
MPPPSFAIAVERHDDRVLISVAGEVDYGRVAQLRAVLVDEAQTGPSVVVVDLTEASLVDSMALSVLIQAKRSLESRDGELKIANPSPNVQRTLELAGVSEYLLA